MSSILNKGCYGIATIAALAVGLIIFGAAPAQATGWNVDEGTFSDPSIAGFFILTYEAHLRGAEYGLGSCNAGSYQSSLSGAYFDCVGFLDPEGGIGQIVRNNAHSIGADSCYGATTWVYANSVGDYNWVHGNRYGTLNSAVANNENSAGIGNLC